VTPSTFLSHWGIRENPFRGEEARLDTVFCRITATDAAKQAENTDHTVGADAGYSLLAMAAQHAEFEKFVGDFQRPASSVVFGEKGSGKTAMRLQIAQAAAVHNARNPDGRVLLIAYDELHPFLERLHNRLRRVTRKGETTATESLRQMRLADHVDAIMHLVVPKLVDIVMATTGEAEQAALPSSRPIAPPHLRGLADPELLELGTEPKKVLRRTDPAVKRDLLALVAAYDKADEGTARVRQLRWALQVRRPLLERTEAVVAYFGWLPPALVALWLALTAPKLGGAGAGTGLGRLVPDAPSMQLVWRQLQETFGLTGTGDSRTVVWTTAFVALVLIWIVFLARRAWTDRFRLSRQTSRMYRQVRVTGRSEASVFQAIRALPASMRTSNYLPVSESEDLRLRMFDRLRRVLRLFGYSGLVVVVDRVDEPLIVGGDAERMKTIVWPMLTSKFLQQEAVGIKLLLPIELRHMLFKESAAFFQQARLDKQNLVEQLSWTGSTLYDLCTARLIACRGLSTGDSGKQMITLADLFDADVGRQGLVEALEQMRQPRDAFKFLYHCIVEHCAQATSEQNALTIPKRVLEDVRKAQVERLRQLAMGVRPA